MAGVPGLLEGRVAFVTGGGRGLGRAIVSAFAQSGAVGLVLDHDADAAGHPPIAGFATLTGDVTNETDIAAAVQAVQARFGRLDIAVANAGIVPPWRATAALDFAEWDGVMAVNVRGVAATLKHAAPAMIGRGGAIVAMASINAFTAHPLQMAYTASKHAVLGIVRAAARDLGRHGIRVNALAPGPVATEALVARVVARSRETGAAAPEEALARLAAGNAMARLVTADEVAKAALFLASDLAGGITGAMLPVDAGLL
jgi:NAD(P)-dependent dehydrogenase (short-subunit alcohol dehydrogenase family)